MFHLGGVFLLDVLLRPRVPGYCAVGSSWWLGIFGTQPSRTYNTRPDLG